MKHVSKLALAFLLGGFLILVGCSEDEPDPEAPKARFSWVADENDFLTIHFTDESVAAESYSWDFGDESTSTDASVSHTFAAAGTYDVVLTVTGPGGEDSRSESITIIDPLAAQRALIGENGKTWKLIRDISTGVYPFQVGPTNRSEIWWALGTGQPICERPCILDDTYTFNTDGTMTREVGDDFWGEGGVWPDELVGCFDASVATNWVNKDGADVSAWGDGTFDFDYDVTEQTLTLTGLGAYMGLSKVGTDKEYITPQQEVQYKVVKIVDSEVDTLVLETILVDDDGAEFGYWSLSFVSYDTPSAEPAIPECEEVTTANVTFMLNFNDYTGTATTPEVNGTFNGWCGNCNAMSDADGDGIWTVTLELPIGSHEFKFAADAWADQESLTEGSTCTVTSNGNTNRTLVVEGDMTYGPVCWASCENCDFTVTMSDIAGRDWHLPAEPGVVRVGSYIGGGDWWTSDQAWADAGPCLFDDTFNFNSTAGTMTRNVGAEVFTEGAMEGIDANGCVAVSNLPANLATWANGTFNYTFTDATADALATLAVTGNGAYIGFYKGKNGGELTQPEDGTVTYKILNYIDGPTRDVLEITIDISAEQNGSAYWTYRLINE